MGANKNIEPGRVILNDSRSRAEAKNSDEKNRRRNAAGNVCKSVLTFNMCAMPEVTCPESVDSLVLPLVLLRQRCPKRLSNQDLLLEETPLLGVSLWHSPVQKEGVSCSSQSHCKHFST